MRDHFVRLRFSDGAFCVVGNEETACSLGLPQHIHLYMVGE